MEDFPWWSEEHRKLAAEAGAFAREVAPRAEEAWWRREFPRDILNAAAKRGYFGVAIPAKYGGMGLGATGACIVNEAISGVAGAGQGTYESSLFGGAHQVLRFGTERQKRRFLPRIAAGEFGAICITEPFAGTDAAAIETEARRDGARYVISGKKRFITSAGVADRYMVYARTSGRAEDVTGNRHLSAFIVEKGMPGFAIERVNELLGWDNIPNGCLDLDEVLVPVENRIGADGQGWQILVEGLNFERTVASAGIVGGLGEIPGAVAWYAARRVQFGRRTLDMPVNQFKIADILARLKLARLAVYYSAHLLDSGRPNAMEACLAKLFSADFGLEAATEALQVMGADAVTRFYPLERVFRSMKMFQMAGGTDEALKLNIFRMGLRELNGRPVSSRRTLHPELRVAVPAPDGPAAKLALRQGTLLRVLADGYRVDPGLHMTWEDLRSALATDDEALGRVLLALERAGLARVVRRDGRVELARATYKGLRKAGPLTDYRWFPAWVKSDDVF